jgi:hypothetical protein
MAERDDLKDTRKKDLREESMKDNELKQSGSASALEDSRSEGMQSYDKTRNLSTEVLSDTTNEDLKDVRARSVRGNANNQMRRLKIGGESLVRKETDKQGREKFRDETSGQYATEESFDDSESRVASLANSIRKGKTIGAMEENTSTLGFGAAKASAGLSKNIGDNAGTLQEIFEKEGDETQAELKKLVELMANAQDLKGKDAEKAKNEISKQVARLETKAGDNKDKINQALGLDNVKKDIRSGSRIKEALNIDQGATGLTAVKQAFSPTRLFGDANTGGLSGGGGIMSSLASKVLGTGDNAADAQQAKNARMEIAKEDQAKGMAAAVGAEGLQLIGGDEVDVKSPAESKKTKDASKEKESIKEIQTNTIKTSNNTSQALDSATEKDNNKITKKTTENTNNNNTSKVAQARATSTKPGDGTFKGGIDRETTGQKQVELLEDIKDILEDVAANGGMGGGGGGGGGGFFGGGGKNKGKNKRGRKPKSRMGRIGNALKGTGKGLLGGGVMRGGLGSIGRLGGAVAGVGMGAYEAVTGVMSAENKMENLEISAEEAQSQKGEAIGSGAGGAGGAIAGAAAGAAIGSVVPIVGTAIGGIIGGALGYFGGSWLGGKAGEALADAIPVDPGEIAESNEAAQVALDKIEEANPELRAEIEKQAEDNYQALLGDKSEDEYSDNDKAAMKNAGLVKAIQNKDEAIQKLQAEGANVDLSKLETTGTSNPEDAEQQALQKELDISSEMLENNAFNSDGMVVDAGEPVPIGEIEAAYKAGKNGAASVAAGDSMSGIKSSFSRNKQNNKENRGSLEKMAERMDIEKVDGELTGKMQAGIVTEVNGQSTAEFLTQEETETLQSARNSRTQQDQAAENALTSGDYVSKESLADSLEQGTMRATAARGQPVPTGTALENMPASQNAPAPVINNVTNNSGGGASKEPKVIVANAPTPRPNTNTIERYQDRRYRG